MNKVFLIAISLINPVLAGVVQDRPERPVTVFEVHDLFRGMYEAHRGFILSPNNTNRDKARNTLTLYQRALISIPAGDKRLLALVALNDQYKKSLPQ